MPEIYIYRLKSYIPPNFVLFSSQLFFLQSAISRQIFRVFLASGHCTTRGQRRCGRQTPKLTSKQHNFITFIIYYLFTMLCIVD